MAPHAGLMIGAMDPWGRKLQFGYNPAGKLITLTDPSGNKTAYTYDTSSAACTTGECARFVGVQYSDGGIRTYHWNEAGFNAGNQQPNALTGVTDENGSRTASFGYDANGFAISTERAGGIEKFSISRSGDRIVVTDPLGTSHQMTIQQSMGVMYSTGSSQPAGSGCAASSSTLAYDANGNVASKDDFNGVRSCYANDLGRNLELTRVEGLSNTAVCSAVIGSGAALPSGSRKTSTSWHPDWRLTVKVAEPGKLTTRVYNGQPDPSAGGAVASCAPATALLPDGKPIAVLCKQIEQATSDISGAAGFGAALQAGVPARIWRWTYNGSGQMLTATDARNHTTTYSYYVSTTPGTATMGDLQSVTNAQGQLTQYTRYDPHGNLLQSIDPNGVVTSSTYDLRQRLTSVDVGGQLTSYSYDPVGQLTRVTQADGSAADFVYDPAHRLTAVTDSLGNRVSYTLDNMGNRVAEQVKDAGGNLSRQLSRVFDALNRKQQTVGVE